MITKRSTKAELMAEVDRVTEKEIEANRKRANEFERWATLCRELKAKNEECLTLWRKAKFTLRQCLTHPGAQFLISSEECRALFRELSKAAGEPDFWPTADEQERTRIAKEARDSEDSFY